MSKSRLLKAILFLACLGWACDTPPATSREQGATGRVATQESGGAQAAADGAPPVSAAPVLLARLELRSVDESSGLAASRRNPGLFWTHNDSGDDPLVYAFDRAGKKRGVWRVRGARARDWEDIAAGPGPEPGRPYLYVGDIGDNKRSRESVIVYRFPEPATEPGDDESGRKNPRLTEPAEAITLKYPDGPHDAEALMVHPSTGDIYVVTKDARVAGVYKLSAPPSAAAENTLTRVGEFRAPGGFGSLITGGDISPDGRRVVLCDYLAGYEMRLPDSPGQTFDAVWRQPPALINLGARNQGEAVCYTLDGSALLATSEGSAASVFEVKLLRPR